MAYLLVRSWLTGIETAGWGGGGPTSDIQSEKPSRLLSANSKFDLVFGGYVDLQ